jgi:hypothetical protein
MNKNESEADRFALVPLNHHGSANTTTAPESFGMLG